jgi:large subunit ribosomal protein L24e
MECSFCGREIRKGLESVYVTAKGKLYYFCSSKCDKNMLKLGRSKRKVKWTATYRKEKDARIKLLGQGVKPGEIRELEKKEEQKEQHAESAAPEKAAVKKPEEKPKEARKEGKKPKK